jgi:hypothetical protein
MQIEVRTRYAFDDPEMTSDYYAIEIYVDNKLMRSYGDYYHDKGYDKMQGWLDGFIDGVSLHNTELTNVVYTSKADCEV